MVATKLDLTFREGDDVTITTSAGLARVRGTILHLGMTKATVRWKHGPRYDDFTQGEYDLRDIKFACHHHGAPFEKIVLDEEAAYKDGHHSGLAIGLAGQFYQAGGPGGIKMSGSCRHHAQYNEFDERNNKAWRKGWAAGQERARMAKPLDFTKPLRTVKDRRPVHYVGPVTPKGTQHVVNIADNVGPPPTFGDTTFSLKQIDQFGSMGHGNYEAVIENVPPKTCEYIAVHKDGEQSGGFFNRQLAWDTCTDANHLIQIDREGDEVIGVGVLKRANQ